MEDKQLNAQVQKLTVEESKQKVQEGKVQGGQAKKQKKKKQEKPKAEKQQKKQQPAEEKQTGPKTFSQIDIRVSQIVECWKHPQSENLYCEKILVCGEVRQIASGLQKFVPLDHMKGKVIVMANLKPRPLAGFQSNGMVVCASNADHTAVQLIIPQGQLGERVYLQGYEQLFAQGPIQPVLNPKKKIVEKCLQFFKTDQQGFVTWKDIRVRTKAGYLRSQTIKNGNVS